MAESSSTPRLTVSSLPSLAAEDGATKTSPARGAEMKNFLETRLQKKRAPPLIHTWDFYHDRQDRSQATNLSSTNANATASNGQAGGDVEDSYEARLEKLAVIDDVRKFWNVFNNFPIHNLALRDSIHLFHKGKVDHADQVDM